MFRRCLFVLVAAMMCGAASANEIDVAKLTKAMQSPLAVTRIEACQALANADADSLPKATIAVLARTALDRDKAVRQAAFKAIRKLKISDEIIHPIIVKTLRQADPAAVTAALQTLADDGKEALPGLIRALNDKEACYWACIVIAEIGEEAAEATPHLAKMLSHEMPECRMQALEALGKIGPKASSASGDVAKLLEDKIGGVRYTALFAIGKMKAKDALPAVKKAMTSKDPIEKLLAAWAQLQLATDDEAAVTQSIDVILAGLASDDATLRSVAVEAIQESDAPTAKVAPALIKALENGDEEFVDNVVSAMASRGAKATRRIARGLADPKLRHFALRVVARMGPEAKSLVPQLVEMEATADNKTHREIHFALGAIGPDAKAAVTSLMKDLDSDAIEVQHSAAYALGKIGPNAKAAASKLMEKLQSKDSFMQLASVWALLEISPNERLARAAVPLLVKGLSNDEEMVRVEVARSLGNLGSVAKAAKPALMKVAESDQSLLVREMAKESLSKLK